MLYLNASVNLKEIHFSIWGYQILTSSSTAIVCLFEDADRGVCKGADLRVG
ncbi:hypothetical protein D3C76_1731020 [compost metagenome]